MSEERNALSYLRASCDKNRHFLQ